MRHGSIINTFDISKVQHKPNGHKPHGCMFQRDWSLVKKILRDHYVTIEEIAIYANLNMSTVHAALDLAKFARVRHMSVVRTRLAVQILLARKGYEADDAHWLELWNEYDARLIENL